MFGWNNRKKSNDDAQLVHIDELTALLKAHKDFVAPHGTCARTRVVQNPKGYTEYSRAERVSRTEWEVKNIKVYDYGRLTEDELKASNFKSLSPQEQEKYKNDRVFECKTHTVKQDGQDISRVSFVMAMSILADLQIKNAAANPVLLDLDQENEVAKADYFAVPHYTEVADWNNMSEEIDAISENLRLKHMTEDGAVVQAVTSADSNDLPDTLSKAFNGKAEKNLDVWLKAVKVATEMNSAVDAVQDVASHLSKIADMQNFEILFYNFRDLWQDFQTALSKLDQIDDAGALARTVKLELAQALVAANVFGAQVHIIEHQNPSKKTIRADVELRDLPVYIESFKKNIVEACDQYELGVFVKQAAFKEIENHSKESSATRSIKPVVQSLHNLVDDYKKAHEQWQKTFKTSPDATATPTPSGKRSILSWD